MITPFKIQHWAGNLMLKCFDHKTSFSDTNSHVRPAIEISKICCIACGGLELKKSN